MSTPTDPAILRERLDHLAGLVRNAADPFPAGMAGPLSASPLPVAALQDHLGNATTWLGRVWAGFARDGVAVRRWLVSEPLESPVPNEELRPLPLRKQFRLSLATAAFGAAVAAASYTLTAPFPDPFLGLIPPGLLDRLPPFAENTAPETPQYSPDAASPELPLVGQVPGTLPPPASPPPPGDHQPPVAPLASGTPGTPGRPGIGTPGFSPGTQGASGSDETVQLPAQAPGATEDTTQHQVPPAKPVAPEPVAPAPITETTTVPTTPTHPTTTDPPTSTTTTQEPTTEPTTTQTQPTTTEPTTTTTTGPTSPPTDTTEPGTSLEPPGD
ncbi:hypothetical protein AB0I53_27050 [Saccharopolyspora sp. NPDC050389]|uniref:hypothetical protein n=1 Tax=Saccharopolyspora sp. NPDC050389 TaxID=3155516 RepID=UPI0033C62C29